VAQEQSVLPKASDLAELASRPAQVIEHPSWTTARETVLAQVTARPCLIVMLGPPGSGKTTLLRNLTSTLRERGRAACLLVFDDNRPDLERADVVLADEADRISSARLHELSRGGERPVVLAVLPASGERFWNYPGVTTVRLASLPPDQACAFLAERLAQLGLPNGCLTEAAWARLVAHARGVPRLLIALLGLSLFVAGEAGARQVTGAHVEEAVWVRGGGADPDEIEPALANADSVEQDVPRFLAGGGPAASAADRKSERRRRRRTQVVATLVATCLFAAAGALLTGRQQRAVEQTASSRAGPVPIVSTQKAVSVTTGTPGPPKEVASEPALPAAPVIPPAPASPPLAPAPEPNNAAAPPAAAPAAVAGATQELPSGALIHVVIIYPRGDQAAAQRAKDLARRLRSAGLALGDPFPVPPRESKRGIRYYFAQDESAAIEVGRRLGGQYGEGRLVRLRRSAGLPRPGTIEIALGG
jgi:energy-coupling factor transporter ATP-binding protein EcfA2